MYASKLVAGAGQRFESARRLLAFCGICSDNDGVQGDPRDLYAAFDGSLTTTGLR
jgi:hypothetical protein